MISAFFCFSYFKIIDILSIGVTLSSDIKNILNKKFMKQEVLFLLLNEYADWEGAFLAISLNT